MSEPSSPRLQVFIGGTIAPALVLIELKQVTARGLADLRALIASGSPVIDVEMFTNDWYEHAAMRILDMVTGWDAQGIGYILRETLTGSGGGEGAGDASRISLDELRDIASSAHEDRTRMEELDDLRYGNAP